MRIRNDTENPIEIGDIGITAPIGITDLNFLSSVEIKNSDDLYSFIINDETVVIDDNNIAIDKEDVINNFGIGHIHKWDNITEKPYVFEPKEHTHTQHPTHLEVDARIQAVVDGAPEALDTLNEIATRLGDDQNAIDSIIAELSTKSVIGHDHDSDYHTKPFIDESLSGKASIDHRHDEDYYTEIETDNLLDQKSNTTHQHDYSEIINPPADDDFKNCVLTTVADNNDILPIFCFVDNRYKKIKKSDLVESGSGNNFYYFNAQYKVDYPEHGGTFTRRDWRTRPLNTTISNDIPGLYLDRDTIIIPPGSYWINASAMACGVCSHILGISYGENLEDPFIVGMTYHNDTTHTNQGATCNGKVIFQETRKIQLVHVCERTVNTYGMGMCSPEFEIRLRYNAFANIEIWKVS